MNKPIGLSLRNLAMLVFIALPLAMVVAWILGQIAPPAWRSEMDGQGSKLFSTFLFHFLILLVPSIIGGVIHQLILWFVPLSREQPMRRAIIVLTALVIPAAFLLTGTPPEILMSPRALVAIAVGLLTYGFLAKPIREQADA